MPTSPSTATSGAAGSKPKRARQSAAKKLILPPCLLVGADANAWSVAGRVGRANRRVDGPGVDMGRWMSVFAKSYEETLALALCLVTPVSVAQAGAARWAPFFSDHPGPAYQKACAGEPVWRSGEQSLEAYLASGGDLSRADAFGRNWLFHAQSEHRAGDHALALESTPNPLALDSLGLPFFARGADPELARLAIAKASEESLEAALSPDKAFGCDASAWLLTLRFAKDASASPPSAEALAAVFEGLAAREKFSLRGALPEKINLSDAFAEAMKGAALGGSRPGERLGAALARLASRAEGQSPLAAQLKTALAQAKKANKALIALVESDDLDTAIPKARSPSAGRGRPRA